MRIVATISRYLLGIVFLVFGLNGFFHFIPQPELTRDRPHLADQPHFFWRRCRSAHGRKFSFHHVLRVLSCQLLEPLPCRFLLPIRLHRSYLWLRACRSVGWRRWLPKFQVLQVFQWFRLFLC